MSKLISIIFLIIGLLLLVIAFYPSSTVNQAGYSLILGVPITSAAVVSLFGEKTQNLNKENKK